MDLRYLAISLFLLLFSCKNKQDNITKTEIKQYSIEQFMDNESVRGGSFSYDNKNLLISSNKTGIYNVYTIPVQGGKINSITKSDSTSYFAQSYFPKDNRMLLTADGNGDEINHLYVVGLDSSIKDITPDKGAKSSFYGWSKDGNYLYFGSNKRDPRYFDVYKMSLQDYSYKMIYQNNDGLEFSGMSDDENYYALSKSINTNDTDLFIYDVQNQKMTKINKNQSANSAQDFSIDNAKFYYTTDDAAEFSYLMSYDLSTQTKKEIIKKSWDIIGAGFTKDGNYMVTYTNEDGKNVVNVLKTDSMKPISLPDFKDKSITSVRFSNNEEWMSMYVGGSNLPSDLYVYNINSQDQNKLTHVLNNEINSTDLVKAKVIRYKSFDGVEIPAIYYLPHQASVENKVPALVWVHGGPGGQSRQNFSSFIQYLVNHGYAVLAVNNRGSSGYGKTFYQMDDKNHGDKDLKDCVEGKNWLMQQSEIDADKIGIIGGSYGGYMTMAALSFTPNEFEVGVNLFGVTNWIRTLRSIPPYWESFREALYKELGDPYTSDSIRLKQISPLFHTENVTKPLIVLQGSKDPRVLQVESDEIVSGVKKNGVPVEYVLFEDEGHGFIKKENQIEAYKRILKFLNKHLKKNHMSKN